MEVPNGWMPQDHEQDAAIANAVHQVNEEYDNELEDALEFAFDVLRRLHEMGYYIAQCGKDYEPASERN